MDIRDLFKEYAIKKPQDTLSLQEMFPSERGIALFTAMMSLILVSGLAFFTLQNATTEMQIANESSKSFVRAYHAESGVEHVLAWFNNPAKSPNPLFFDKKVCEGDSAKPGQTFSSLIKDIGETITFRFYHSSRGCVVETINSGHKVTVNLEKNPMPKMTKTEVVYGPKDVDPLLEARMKDIRRFAKRFGRYFIVSSKGSLEENGIDRGTFDTIFANQAEFNGRPVFIDVVENYSTLQPLKIGHGPYKGYFYFFGDIEIEGGGSGQSVSIDTDCKLDPVDLAGFFYTRGRMIIDGRFVVYGAIYAGSGFERDGLSVIDVCYNNDYSLGFKGVLPLIPIIGTHKTM